MGSRNETIVVTVTKWHDYNYRKDINHASWFRLNHSLFEDHQFFDFSPMEILAWIYILCQTSKKSEDTVTINLRHVQAIGRLKLRDFYSALEKLKLNGIVTVSDTSALREREDTCSTLQDTTLHNKTEYISTDSRNLEVGAVEDFGIGSDVSKILVDRKVAKRVQVAWLSAYKDAGWISQELLGAAAWELANPNKRKRNFARFMTNWLQRNWEKKNSKLPSNQVASKSISQIIAERENRNESA